eukprot:scaffold21915_cov73-Cylindrotheca_fusiformis.AAC.1
MMKPQQHNNNKTTVALVVVDTRDFISSSFMCARRPFGNDCKLWAPPTRPYTVEVRAEKLIEFQRVQDFKGDYDIFFYFRERWRNVCRT